MLYLDYAATTPLNPEVGEAYFHLLKTKFANPDSIPDFASEEKEKPSCREGFSLYL